MPKCDMRDDLDTRATGIPDKCPFDAQYVVHQLGGGKDWYLCKKHYNQVKRQGFLDKLIRLKRVEKL